MIIDANMHWLPEDLFTNIALRDAFLACVPKEEGELAYLSKMPGSELEQIVIEKPEGRIVAGLTRRGRWHGRPASGRHAWPAWRHGQSSDSDRAPGL